jgi:chitinase
MNQVEIVCIIVAAVGAIFGVCGIIFPKLTKKGIDTNAILSKVDSGLEVAGKAVDAIKAIAPNTPYISTAEAIIEFADQGVRQAEQLYISNQISADARKTEAVKLTKNLLTAAGVTITPQIETIINGCVEAATFTLPQTHTVSDSPVASSAPAASDSPAASSAPTVSDSPAASSVPAVSDSPVASSAPAVNDAPAVSSVPTVSNSPAASSNPTVSNSLPASSNPVVSDSLMASNTQVVSDSPTAGAVTVDQIDQAIATLSAVKAEKTVVQPMSSESGAVASDTTGAV